MSKNKHTPGPWSVWTSCSWRRICSADGRSVCTPVVQRSDNHPDLHFPNGGENGPDARLMIAAPELLAELDSAARTCHAFDSQCSGPSEECRQPRCREWFALIAKARGES